MPGLGGKSWRQEHALETADALNKIDPDFIRLRPLKIVKGMLLYSKVESGDFMMEDDEELLREERLFIEHLEDVESWVKSDHIMNLLEEVDGRLPGDKGKILSVIDRYFELSPEDRLVYRMGRRTGIYRGVDDLKDEVAFRRLKKMIDEMEKREPGSVERRLSFLLDQYI